MLQFLWDFFELPRYVYDWTRLWYHAFIKFPKNMQGEHHHMCKMGIFDVKRGVIVKHFFCSCGHMVSEIPEEYQPYATMIKKLGNGLD
jgi:hypothetical protein